jgi:hypothetical protein
MPSRTRHARQQDNHLELGPAPALEDSNRANRANRLAMAHRVRKLRSLVRHEGGFKLNLKAWRALQQRPVKDFQYRKKGPKTHWTVFRWVMLAGDVYRECPKKPLNAPLDAKTAKKLAGRVPWRGFLESHRKRDTLHHDPAGALIKAYSEISPEWRAYGRAFYREYRNRNAGDEWTRRLESVPQDKPKRTASVRK